MTGEQGPKINVEHLYLDIKPEKLFMGTKPETLEVYKKQINEMVLRAINRMENLFTLNQDFTTDSPEYESIENTKSLVREVLKVDVENIQKYKGTDEYFKKLESFYEKISDITYSIELLENKKNSNIVKSYRDLYKEKDFLDLMDNLESFESEFKTILE